MNVRLLTVKILKFPSAIFVHHGVLVNNNTLCLSHPLSCENYPFNFQIARPLYTHILIKVDNWQLYTVIRHSVLHACMLVIYGWNICLICLFAWFVKFQILHIWKNVLEFLYSAQTIHCYQLRVNKFKLRKLYILHFSLLKTSMDR